MNYLLLAIQAAAFCHPDFNIRCFAMVLILTSTTSWSTLTKASGLTSTASLLLDCGPCSIPQLDDDLEDAQEEVLAGRLVGQL